MPPLIPADPHRPARRTSEAFLSAASPVPHSRLLISRGCRRPLFTHGRVRGPPTGGRGAPREGGPLARTAPPCSCAQPAPRPSGPPQRKKPASPCGKADPLDQTVLVVAVLIQSGALPDREDRFGRHGPGPRHAGGASPVQSTMVDASPQRVAPPSITASTCSQFFARVFPLARTGKPAPQGNLEMRAQRTDASSYMSYFAAAWRRATLALMHSTTPTARTPTIAVTQAAKSPKCRAGIPMSRPTT